MKMGLPRKRPLKHIALRWSATLENPDFYSHCEAIPRRWREEMFICKDTSLLQRSNMSIEETEPPSRTPAGCYVQSIRNGVTHLVSKTLHPRFLPIFVSRRALAGVPIGVCRDSEIPPTALFVKYIGL